MLHSCTRRQFNERDKLSFARGGTGGRPARRPHCAPSAPLPWPCRAFAHTWGPAEMHGCARRLRVVRPPPTASWRPLRIRTRRGRLARSTAGPHRTPHAARRPCGSDTTLDAGACVAASGGAGPRRSDRLRLPHLQRQNHDPSRARPTAPPGASLLPYSTPARISITHGPLRVPDERMLPSPTASHARSGALMCVSRVSPSRLALPSPAATPPLPL